LPIPAKEQKPTSGVTTTIEPRRHAAALTLRLINERAISLEVDRVVTLYWLALWGAAALIWTVGHFVALL